MPDDITKRVIIAREEDKAAPLMASLKEKGITSYAVPVTRIVYDLSSNLPSDLNTYDWIAFTSANGVRAFAGISSKSGLELDDNLRIAAIGSSTAAEVEDKLRKQAIVSEISSAKSLAELILHRHDDPRNLRVFWPCGEDALPDFENAIVGSGGMVSRWVCYRSEKIEKDTLRSKLELLYPWDLVFFAAPSAVEAFSEAWEDRSGFVAVAIGPTTAEALRIREYNNIVTSNGTSVDECTETIRYALKEQVRN